MMRLVLVMAMLLLSGSARAQDAGQAAPEVLARAESLLATHRLGQARELLEGVAEVESGAARLALDKARLYLQLGIVGKAGSFAQRAVKLSAGTDLEASARETLALAQGVVRLRSSRSPEFEEGSASSAAQNVVDLLRAGKLIEVLRRHSDRSFIGELGVGNADQAAEHVMGLWKTFVSQAEFLGAEVIREHPTTPVADHARSVEVRLFYRAPAGEMVPNPRFATTTQPVSGRTLDVPAVDNGEPDADKPGRLVLRSLRFLMVDTSGTEARKPGPKEETPQSRWLLADVRSQGASLVRADKKLADLVFAARGPSKRFRERYGRDAPAAGQPYRYRQILFALGVAVFMALFMFWLVRRVKKSQSASSDG